MDKQKRAADLVKLLYKYRKDKLTYESSLIKAICMYFDDIKNEELTSGDKFFLRYMSSIIGIPQYFDMLQWFKIEHIDYNYDNIDDLGSAISDSSLYTAPEICLHRYQRDVLNLYEPTKSNRYFLSATTSFGKTYLVYEIIRKMNYDNVLLIFPTLALLSENLNKIFTDKYNWLRERYKIHTLSDIFSSEEHGNLMIYTPERYLSFLDKNRIINFSFVFIDEAYKIDNEYLQDGEEKENERDVAYRIAAYFALKNNSVDCLFAGPYLNIDNKTNSSFSTFLKEYNIAPLNYNKYEIVSKTEFNVETKKYVNLDNQIISLASKKKYERVTDLVRQLCEHNESTIIYCNSKTSVEKCAKEFIDFWGYDESIEQSCSFFLNHMNSLFKGNGKDWIVTKAIKAGIGVHHGFVPKYIQNEIIRLFNKGILKIIIATTTITEGVNTNAKNIVVLSHKKGNKLLKKFDAQNIEGRAGRFLNHYSGRIFIIDKKFSDILEKEDDTINHKYFDKNIDKGAVEVDFVKEPFLNIRDISLKKKNTDYRKMNQLPSILDLSFRTISVEDKYKVYTSIKQLSHKNLLCIKLLIDRFNRSRFCDLAGVQLICDIIRPIVLNSDLAFLIDSRKGKNNNSVLTFLISLYLKNSFSDSVVYYINQGDSIDNAVRKVARTTYNTMRYQTVKYFGVFNVAYKCFISIKENVPIDEVCGIDLILHRLEYQSDTLMGRLASDAGASPNVINYYDKKNDNEARAVSLYSKLDDYEKQNAESIREIVERDL